MRYRYAGPSPFTSNQGDIFFGRTNDAEALYNSILLNQCTTLVGRSGVGKSSILNADIIPRFKQGTVGGKSTDKRYFVVIRLVSGPWVPDEGDKQYKTLLQKIQDRVVDELGALDEISFLPKIWAKSEKKLSFLLKQYQFNHYVRGKNVVFFLVVDQVEEFFTYPAHEFREVVQELREILSPYKPDYISAAVEALELEDPDALSDNEMILLDTALHVKFLFSIRSDKLGLLIRFKDAIPGIFSNPFELKPLSKQQAFEAIKFPAEREGDFYSPPFVIPGITVESIIDFLYNLPNYDLDNNLDDLKIDPISLQLVCQYIELKVAPFDSDRLIEIHEIKDLSEVLVNFYSSSLGRLQCSENEKLRARVLIEEKLIYEPDKRRRQLFGEECDMDMSILKQLVQVKLLREIHVGSGMPYYEVAHDWMILPILKAKKLRLSALESSKQERLDVTLFSNSNHQDGFDVASNQSKADYYFDKGNYEKAIQFYTRLIQESKFEAERHNVAQKNVLNRGEAYYKLEEYNNAIEDFSQVLQFDPKNTYALLLISFCYYRIYDLAKAITHYKKIISVDETFTSAYYNLGIVYLEMGDLDSSQEMFKHVLNQVSTDSDSWYHLGVVYNRLYNFSQAIFCLKTACDLNGGKLETKLELAYAYAQTEDFKEAISIYNQLYKENRNNTGLLNRIIKIAQLIGDEYELRRAELTLVASENADASVFLELAELEMSRNNFLEALNFLNYALELEPRNIQIHLRRADCCRTIGDQALLVASYIDLLNIGYEDSEILLFLGEVSLNNGDLQKAVYYYGRSFDFDKSHENFNFQYAKLLLQVNKRDESLEVLEVINERNPVHLEAMTLAATLYLEKGDIDSALKLHPRLESSILKNPEPSSLRSATENMITVLEQLPSFKKQMEKAEHNFDLLQQTIRELQLARSSNHL